MSQRTSSQICDKKVTNRYHLYSILVHRGTLDYGHYYSFIRPNITDERWFMFNDSEVSEVTKSFAFKQGSGGQNMAFDFERTAHHEF
jgi:ubiquitin C-terminal hydrolase